MKSFALLPVALLTLTAAAQPKRLAHRNIHDRRSVIQKRDTVLYTEMVVVTECVNITETVYVDDLETATTIYPSSIDTSPHTTLLGPSTIKDKPNGGVFLEIPKSEVTTAASPVVTPVVTPVVPVTTQVIPDPVQPGSSSPVVPSSPPVPSGGGSAENIYNLALPPTNRDRTSECMGSSCTGKATFYDNLTDGMCCGYDGFAGQDKAKRIIALPQALMGSSSNANSAGMPNQPVNGNCGRVVAVKCPSTGKETTAQVVDKCPGCSGYAIDLSEATFEALGVHQDQGHMQVEWHFLS